MTSGDGSLSAVLRAARQKEERMPKRPDRFVVGFPGEGNVVYGQDNEEGDSRYVLPLKLSEAKAMLADLYDSEMANIYELVKRKK